MAGKPKYSSIFNSVVHRYHTEIANQWPSVEKRYRKLSDDHAHVNFNPRVVKPNGSDFIADVELSAKGVLTPYQYGYFKGWYLEQDTQVMRLYFSRFSKDDYKAFRMTLTETVGAQFESDKLNPDTYFKASSL